MLRAIFILLTFGLANQSFADVEDVKKFCLGNYGYGTASFKPPMKEMEKASSGANVHKRMASGVYKIDSLVNPYEHAINEGVRTYLVSTINDHIKKNKLNPYQKVCLLNCVTGNYLKYNVAFTSLYRPEEKCYISAEGVCGHFSYMFYDLAKNLGIENVSEESSNNHGFNSVIINDQKYYIEPQNESCDLYTYNYRKYIPHKYEAPKVDSPTEIQPPKKTKNTCSSEIVKIWKNDNERESVTFNPNGSLRFTSSNGSQTFGTYTCPKDFGAKPKDVGLWAHGWVEILITTGTNTIPAGKYYCTYYIESKDMFIDGRLDPLGLTLLCINSETGLSLW
jgi:hypothetical protein